MILHRNVSMEKYTAPRRCLTSTTIFANPAWGMTQTHKTSRLSASHFYSILIRPILRVLEAHLHGQFICSLEASQSMSGLRPPPTPVITSHTCHQCVILMTCTLVYANTFTSYPTVFKISTNNNMEWLRWPPPL